MNLKIMPGVSLVALLALACNANTAPSPTGAPVTATTPGSTGPSTVRVAVGAAPSLVYLPYDVAKALKYYADEGLDVELQYLASGAQAADALLSGAAQFSGNSLEHAIKAQPRGKNLKMVVSFARLPAIALMVRADLKEQVKEIKDFKGRRIGVTAIGADTHVLAQTLAVKAGLKPGDFTVVPTGSDTMAAAFDAKQIDVGLNADPFATQLVKSGKVTLLADLRTEADTVRYFGGDFQLTGALVSADLIKRQPELVQKMVNALVRAEVYISKHTAHELAEALPNTVTGQDKEAWIDALTATRAALSVDGKVTPFGVENALDAQRVFGAIGPRDQIDVQALYDNSFVEKALTTVR